MSASYDRLGLTELRDDADRVLQTNYPNTTIKSEGLRTKKTSWWQFW
jgi:outer membrane protein assembly factor BamD